jgi:DNA-binding MarR family transcriptional regulator
MDPDVLAEALRPALLRVSRRLRQAAHRAGLSAQDALVLGFIQKNPGTGVSGLAEVEQVSRPAMSGQVKKLEAAGWIVRHGDAADGRRSGLAVTPAGMEQLLAIRKHRNDWLAARLAHLNEDERERLAAAAEPLLKLLAVAA